MTAFKEAIKSGLEEYLEGLKKAVDELTPAELRWQPTLVSNPISWIVWHMARVEDRWVNRVLRGDVELWVRDGWHTKKNQRSEVRKTRGRRSEVRKTRGQKNQRSEIRGQRSEKSEGMSPRQARIGIRKMVVVKKRRNPGLDLACQFVLVLEA